MHDIEIIKSPENTPENQKQIADVVAAAWWADFARLAKSRDAAANSLAGGFAAQHFFLARLKGRSEGSARGQTVGVAACVPGGQRSFAVIAKKMRKNLNFPLNLFAPGVLRKEFEGPPHVAIGPDEGFIEFVGTLPECQGKGVATALMRAIMDSTPHPRLVLEVVSSNTGAHALYQRLGFVEFARIPEKNPRQAGFDARIYMEWVRA